MMQEVNEKDWKLFRERLPKWQEAYMENLIEKYQGILASNKAASKRFWALERSIYRDKYSPGVQLHMRRSTMVRSMMALLDEKIITAEDLEGFSDELRESLSFITRMS